MSVESSERMEESASQLSAMFDGELSAAECELLSRRLARDEALRGRWARYALIGAAMRAEPIATVSGGFARRVSAVIDQQDGRQKAQLNGKVRAGGTSGFMRFRTVALGGTLAAGVAAVAVFMLRNEMLSHNEALVARTPAVQRIATPGAAAANTAAASTLVAASGGSREPASYIVPPGSNSMLTPVPVSLANYVVAHSEYSSPLARRGLLSALVASESGEMTVTPGTQGPVRTDPTIVVEAGR